ncbi:hypothetical protein C4K00_1897 [Pseudomonas synxantha]|nr:hypothetical protein C4K00_1897 [Pseudomonas synxantha]AZE77796.1 hypothetical protein C4J99_2005 [Pseudomonas synxantha]
MTAPTSCLQHTLQYTGQVLWLRALGHGLRSLCAERHQRFENDIDMKLSSIGPRLAQVLLT